MSTSPVLGIPYIVSQQSQPEVTHNDALNRFQVMLAAGVLEVGRNTPPISPEEGDTYIVGPSPTGAWAGRPNVITGFFSSQWVFIPGNDSNGTPIAMGPKHEGLQIWSKPDNTTYVWTDLGVSPGNLSWQVLPSDIAEINDLSDTAIVTPQEGDILVYRDGLWKNIPRGMVFVTSKDDLPAAVAGVITLAANTTYQVVAGFSLGTDRIAWADGASLKGVESINLTLSYSGSGDMFTFVDTTARISYITLDAPSGRLYNWTDTTTKIGRFHDVTVLSCNKVGIFNGTSGILRFTNHSPASITTDGLEFTGNFRSFLWEVSASTVAAGALFNLGTSTFDSFIASTTLATLNGSSNLISGATGSANINAGGSGLIEVMRTSGTGTPLSGISVQDARWEFRSNDDIANTRPDSLLSMQSNATNTVISSVGVPVLVAGTWVVQGTSQFTGTTAGRSTYNGGKNARLPIFFSITVQPASGVGISISALVAINGSVVPASKITDTADSGNPTSISVPWQYTFQTSDYVEIFVQNNTNTNDLLVSTAIARVN